MPLYTKDAVPSLLIAESQAARFKPSLGQIFGAGAGEGVDLTSVSALKRFMDFKAAGDEEVITHDQYNDSENFRKDIQFFEGMTKGHAGILAKRSDIRNRRKFILNRSRGRFVDYAAMLSGGFVGSIPDPLNFIPLIGIGAKATGFIGLTRTAAKLAKLSNFRKVGIGGRALVSSTEAGIAVGASQPLILKTEQLEQGDYDLRMAAMNIVFAMGIGGTFGAVGGVVSKLSTRDRITGTSKAISDMADDVMGRHVDIEPVIGDRVNRLRMRELIKRHVAGEDIRDERVIHPLLKDAEEFILKTRPDGVKGRDILDAIITPKFLRSEYNKLIMKAVEDVDEIREVVRIFSKTKRNDKEQSLLASFLDKDESGFNKDLLVTTEKEVQALKKQINRNKGALTKLEKGIDKVELSDQTKKTITRARKFGYTETEIRKFAKSERDKIEIQSFTKRQNDIVSKQETISRLEGRQAQLERKIDDLERKQKAIKTREPEIRHDRAENVQPEPEIKVKADEVAKELDNVDTVAKENEKLSDLVDNLEKQGIFSKEEVKAIKDFEAKVNKTTSNVDKVWNAVNDCVTRS